MKILLLLFSFNISCNQISDRIGGDDVLYASDDNLIQRNNRLIIKEAPFTGILTDTFPNGNMQYQIEYVNGVEDGKINGFHMNGIPSYAYQVDNGKRNGEYLEYYPNGELQIRQLYKHGEIIEHKVIDINKKILVNYKKRNGKLYGLLGSSSCKSVYRDSLFEDKVMMK